MSKNEKTLEHTEEGDVQLDQRVVEPPSYAVVLVNDDYTSMEFVVEVLRRFFAKSQDEAVALMVQIHKAGSGVGGIYSRQIAETKAHQVMELAKTRGFPLKCTLEPV